MKTQGLGEFGMHTDSLVPHQSTSPSRPYAGRRLLAAFSRSHSRSKELITPHATQLVSDILSSGPPVRPCSSRQCRRRAPVDRLNDYSALALRVGPSRMSTLPHIVSHHSEIRHRCGCPPHSPSVQRGCLLCEVLNWAQNVLPVMFASDS